MRRSILALLPLCLLLLSACAETVVLLPDDQGRTGAVVVTPHEGSPAVLNAPYTALDTSESSAGEPYQLTEEEVRKRYAETLQALPEPPAKFTLYFALDSVELKPESQALLPDIVAAYQDRASRDVSVVGHTDRSGDKGYNLDLSRQRAKAVAKRLQKMGVDPDIMEITSHGEENPAVPTADGVYEPLNRRVEVTIR